MTSPYPTYSLTKKKEAYQIDLPSNFNYLIIYELSTLHLKGPSLEPPYTLLPTPQLSYSQTHHYL